MIHIFKLVVIKCFLSYFIIVQNKLYEFDDKPKKKKNPCLGVTAEELANYWTGQNENLNERFDQPDILNSYIPFQKCRVWAYP